MLRYECRAPSAPQTEPPTAVDYLLIMPGYVYFLKITFIGENSTLNDEARRSIFFGTEKKPLKLFYVNMDYIFFELKCICSTLFVIAHS